MVSSGFTNNSPTNGIWRYSRFWENMGELEIELLCFREDLRPEDGGLGRAEHFWNVAKILLGPESPKPFDRNPWAEEMAEYASKHKMLSVSGSGSSGKTDFFAVWGIVNFLASPKNTMVLVTSTTLKESRKRIWGSIVDYWMALPDAVKAIGKLVDSQAMIRMDGDDSGLKASDKCGIALVAGEQSHAKEAVGKIIGIKNARIILIADELPELSPAIMEAVKGNLKHNAYVQAIGLGNPKSYYDAHGEFSEPKLGWNSITPRDFNWQTKYGWAIRFDAEESPNLKYPVGEEPWPYLPTVAKIEEAREDLGEDSFSYWRMWKGFWCPNADAEKIYSGTELVYYGTEMPEPKWAFTPVVFASLDAGFTSGGDRSIAYFAKYGIEAGTNKQVLYFMGHVLIKDSVSDKKNFRTQQIVLNWKKECLERGVLPENACVDETGAATFGDIVWEKWSHKVHRINFGGKSSSKIVGEDRVPAESRYGTRCAEIWFGLREFMKGEQIRGLTDTAALKELCERNFTTKKGADGLVVDVEPKKKFKGRTGFSPDIADALLLIVSMARDKKGFKPSYTPVKRVAKARGEFYEEFERFQTRINRPAPSQPQRLRPTSGQRGIILGGRSMRTGIPRLRR